MVGTRTFEGVKENNAPPELLAFLPEDERQRVLLAALEIQIPDENARLHKKITAYKSVVKEWNQVENLGGTVNDDLSLQIRNERVQLEVFEGQDEVEHKLTRKEAQELIIYEDAKRHSRWASNPNIRKHDYVFNGLLRVRVREHRYFRETDKMSIESRLGDILIELYEQAQTLRVEREAREEAERKRREEERRREERRTRYNEEVERTIALKNAALDYETACKIRTFVKAVESACGQDELDLETTAWIDWANKKADWFDPIIARDDELFGERQHEKSEDQQALKKEYGKFW